MMFGKLQLQLHNANVVVGGKFYPYVLPSALLQTISTKKVFQEVVLSHSVDILQISQRKHHCKQMFKQHNKNRTGGKEVQNQRNERPDKVTSFQRGWPPCRTESEKRSGPWVRNSVNALVEKMHLRAWALFKRVVVFLCWAWTPSGRVGSVLVGTHRLQQQHIDRVPTRRKFLCRTD